MSRSAKPSGRVILAIAALWVAGCGNSDSSNGSAQAPLAVLSAFPAELAAVLAHATVDETRTIDGRVFRVGRIGDTPVVISMTGIGLMNARATTRLLLDSFEVRGVVVSGVAGSPLLDGDVTVPATWTLDGGDSYTAEAAWLEEAAEAARDGAITLDSCAIIPEVGAIPGATAGDLVCFPYAPRVVVGGFASSSDPYGDSVFSCAPGGNDVFGCDAEILNATPVSAGGSGVASLLTIDDQTRAAYDQETAAIAAEAVAHGVPFVAFRASSDGGPDPLDLEGFTEFFAYYRLAAYNAAAAAAAFVERHR